MCWAQRPSWTLLSGVQHHAVYERCTISWTQSGFCSSLTSLTAEPPVVSAVMANINEPSEQQTCDGKRAAYAANDEWSWPVRWSVLRIRRSAGTAYKYIWGSSRGRKRLYLKTLQTLTLMNESVPCGVMGIHLWGVASALLSHDPCTFTTSTNVLGGLPVFLLPVSSIFTITCPP